ncbi:MAG: hypothetical protein HKO13_10555 [Sphingomonas sp.]|nr:hypothetical protein [Sphingomonas sp.]
MSLLLSLLLAAQDTPVEVPREVLRCASDKSVDAVLCRAVIAQGEDRYVDSAEAFEEAAGLAASDPDKASRALLAGANMWLAAGDAERAGAAIDKALAIATLDNVQRGFAHLDRARAALMAGNNAMASDHLERARALVPADPWVWYLGAGIALENDELITARQQIEQALVLAPDSGDVLLRAAAIEAAADNLDGARAHLHKVRDVAPGSAAERTAIRLLQSLSEPAAAPTPSPVEE